MDVGVWVCACGWVCGCGVHIDVWVGVWMCVGVLGCGWVSMWLCVSRSAGFIVINHILWYLDNYNHQLQSAASCDLRCKSAVGLRWDSRTNNRNVNIWRRGSRIH